MTKEAYKHEIAHYGAHIISWLSVFFVGIYVAGLIEFPYSMIPNVMIVFLFMCCYSDVFEWFKRRILNE